MIPVRMQQKDLPREISGPAAAACAAQDDLAKAAVAVVPIYAR